MQPRCVSELDERPAQERVLDRLQVAPKDLTYERGEQLALTACELVGRCDPDRGTGVERVDSRLPARMQLHDCQTQCLRERSVLALGIGDRDPPSERPNRAVYEGLDGGALPHADFAGDDDVRVRQQPVGVRGERVVREAASAGEDVGADVDPTRAEAGLAEERVRGAQVRRRRAMARHAQLPDRRRRRVHANLRAVG